MKLPIKKKYFDLIKSGEKLSELRDAHITFVCEETGETMRKDISHMQFEHRDNVQKHYPDVVFDDLFLIEFWLKDPKKVKK